METLEGGRTVLANGGLEQLPALVKQMAKAASFLPPMELGPKNGASRCIRQILEDTGA